MDEVKQRLLSGEYYQEGWEADKIPPLQDRLLPALVLRCVQHLLAWGIQEEGLFRYAFGKIWVPDIKTYLTVPGSVEGHPASIACVQSLTRVSITTS